MKQDNGKYLTDSRNLIKPGEVWLSGSGSCGYFIQPEFLGRAITDADFGLSVAEFFGNKNPVVVFLWSKLPSGDRFVFRQHGLYQQLYILTDEADESDDDTWRLLWSGADIYYDRESSFFYMNHDWKTESFVTVLRIVREARSACRTWISNLDAKRLLAVQGEASFSKFFRSSY